VDEHEEPLDVAALTTEIVVAFVSHHEVGIADVSNVIKVVRIELASLGTGSDPTTPERMEPAVPVRRSVRPEHLVCLLCGNKQKLLKRHLAVEHELTPNQYRETFRLKPDYPMAAPNYAQQRRELAVKIGLGRPKKAARRPGKSSARSAAAKADS
jgi:predicted transcriptional regulator